MTEKREKYVYKTVYYQALPGKLVSVCYQYMRLNKDAKDIVCEYKIGKVTEPKVNGSALFAFKTKQLALIWLECHVIYGAVMKCEYEEYDKQIFIVPAISPHEIIKMWKALKNAPLDLIAKLRKSLLERNKFGHANNVYIQEPPKGTVACKWIKPVEIIKTKRISKL